MPSYPGCPGKRLLNCLLLPHVSKVLFLALSVTFLFFGCASNISRTAERFCATFKGKTCLVPPTSFSVKARGQRSRSPGTKTRCALPSPPASTEWNALAANNVTQHQQTEPFRRCQGVISAACVRSVFGKTSLALVIIIIEMYKYIITLSRKCSRCTLHTVNGKLSRFNGWQSCICCIGMRYSNVFLWLQIHTCLAAWTHRRPYPAFY